MNNTFACAGRSKPHRFRPGTVALREIRKYQRSTELLIRKMPFARLVRLVPPSFYTPGSFFNTILSTISTISEQNSKVDLLVPYGMFLYRVFRMFSRGMLYPLKCGHVIVPSYAWRKELLPRCMPVRPSSPHSAPQGAMDDASKHMHTSPSLSCTWPPRAQVRELTNMVAPEPFRWTAEALLATQEVRASQYENRECIS